MRLPLQRADFKETKPKKYKEMEEKFKTKIDVETFYNVIEDRKSEFALNLVEELKRDWTYP